MSLGPYVVFDVVRKREEVVVKCFVMLLLYIFFFCTSPFEKSDNMWPCWLFMCVDFLLCLASTTTTTMTNNINIGLNLHDDWWQQTRLHHPWKGAQTMVSTVVWALSIIFWFFFTPLMFFLFRFNNDKCLASLMVGTGGEGGGDNNKTSKRGFETVSGVLFFLFLIFYHIFLLQ